MAYRFQVNDTSCINCGICMDLCPVRCLDMTRPSGEGERGEAKERLSPIPTIHAERPWMMMKPVQVAACIGCQICVQECPTNAITIESKIQIPIFAKRGLLTPLPVENGWQPLDAYTRATPEEPGEAPWGAGHDWHVAERQSTWQTWRSWLGERKEDLRAPCQAACPVGTNAGLYVSLIGQGRYEEALQVAAEPNPFPAICGRVCTAPCDHCRLDVSTNLVSSKSHNGTTYNGKEYITDRRKSSCHTLKVAYEGRKALREDALFYFFFMRDLAPKTL